MAPGRDAAVALVAGTVIVPSALAAHEHGTPDAFDEPVSAQELRNQKAAVALLDQAFNQHRPGKVAEKYISADTCIQHNPNFGNGRDAFVTGVTGYLQQFPDASLTLKRTVTQVDLVVVQGLAKTSAEDRGTGGGGHLPLRPARQDRGALGRPPGGRGEERQRQPAGLTRQGHHNARTSVGKVRAFCAVPGRTDQKG
ncbi:nuclear transport factor 2 family protein [Streptomyces viridochromogenes]|uniref:nuclear transport factor 2 family protein n=1 Tax=Streptomyces viridochromogenes TaxID=1938 RepID=UPI00065C9DF3|nr:nuclear transport factor 2 family protein [Streptomyces viridochromogenes]